MNETYLAWLVLVLFVAIGGLCFKADVVDIKSNIVALTVLLWQIVFAGVVASSLVFAVIWALVTVAS